MQSKLVSVLQDEIAIQILRCLAIKKRATLKHLKSNIYSDANDHSLNEKLSYLSKCGLIQILPGYVSNYTTYHLTTEGREIAGNLDRLFGSTVDLSKIVNSIVLLTILVLQLIILLR